MRKISRFITIVWTIIYSTDSQAYYGEKFCKTPGFHCIKLKECDTGKKTWPDPRELEIIEKINRLHKWLNPEKWILVPDDMAGKTYMDFSPFPKTLNDLQAIYNGLSAEELYAVPPEKNRTAIKSYDLVKDVRDEKVVIWDPERLAWAAYNEKGNLVNWGPGLGGKAYCPDIKRKCRTPSGIFEALVGKGYEYRSDLYPPGCKGEECSWMPHYVRIREDGLGMHGSEWFVGHHASHGCVRLFMADAKWLNQKFFDYRTKKHPGTKVIFLPYPKKH